MAASFQHQTERQPASHGFISNPNSNIVSPTSQAVHRRSYQACDPCRRRKVKCDLGSVDNPRPPPCSRCRRESKKCEFSATRRKRKLSEDEVDGQEHSFARSYGDENTWLGNTRNSAENEKLLRQSPNGSIASSISRTPGSHTTADRVLPTIERGDGREQQLLDNSAAALFTSSVNNPHDALHVLVEAAGQTESLNRNEAESVRLHQSSSAQGKSSQAPIASQHSGLTQIFNAHGVIDPAITSPTNTKQEGSDTEIIEYQNSLKAWAKLRFVRAGWFTGQEAIAYVHYYDHLAPLTPVAIPDYRLPSTHAKLLHDEPVLTITILTLASRYMGLEGRASLSRQYAIHEKLWAYLRGMIERLFWGQEEFTIGSYGVLIPNTDPSSHYTTKRARRASLRTLGTIEALLLLTDWHPRALHFPPSDDTGALVEEESYSVRESEGSSNPPSRQEGISGRAGRVAFSSWLEPAWRSDRMCWMLLGNAYTLSFELGVFDRIFGTTAYAWDSYQQNDPHSYGHRASNLQKLLVVYITQTSGRLGINSMLNFSDCVKQLTERPLTLSSDQWYLHQHGSSPQDRILQFWMDIAAIMHDSNAMLFTPREKTREIIKSGEYLALLEKFQAPLRSFSARLDEVDISKYMKHILRIEYNYTRLYINSLALQAVVERWTNIPKSTYRKTEDDSEAGTQDIHSRILPGSPVSPIMLRELYRGNEEYIQQVVDACRGLITTVVNDLRPGDFLRHAPTFAVGAPANSVHKSLDLLDALVDALENCVVDDVHLSGRIADLLRFLTSSIRPRFIRYVTATANQSRSRTPLPASADTENRLMNGYGNSTRQTGQHGGIDLYRSEQNQGPIRQYPVEITEGSYFYSSPLHSRGIKQPSSSASSSLPHVSQLPPHHPVSFMPPPFDDTCVVQPSLHPAEHPLNSPNQSEGNTNASLLDWTALPLDLFFNNPEVNVDQGFGGIGPTVGEYDMLEVMLGHEHFGQKWEGGTAYNC
ncbi:MAG: hypothetical protein M1834_003408 [Cirrosporium novae-zelandiae]|nr:MAG: hypothetical protein M1834_003408 [Cirrosporium novae-zelandiae]